MERERETPCGPKGQRTREVERDKGVRLSLALVDPERGDEREEAGGVY